MKLNRIGTLKSLLAIVPVLLLALVLQPAVTWAHTIEYFSYNGSYIEDWTSGTWVYSTIKEVDDGDAIPFPATLPASGLEFSYWMSDTPVHLANGNVIDSAEPLTYEQLGQVVAWEPQYFYAVFETWRPTVTYTTDGNGSVSPATEQVSVGNHPVGATSLEPKDGYEFEYWTANVAVELSDGTTIDMGEPIITDEIPDIVVSSDITLTAHFKQVSVDPEPDPVDPVDPDNTDGGDTIKPVDDTDGKVVPKTGDALPGATAAVALGAGVVVAGAALLRKRCQ